MAQFISKIGLQKIILSDVNSTNNFAAKLIKDGITDHGSVIMAENQSDGRGQHDSIWQSAPKLNLLLSIILLPEQMSIRNPIHLNWFISISIIDFFIKKGIKAEIKWPNDILINGKKIAGVLIENKYAGSKLRNSIVGIGINVNQMSFDSILATSMKLEQGIEFDINDLLEEFLLCVKSKEEWMHSKNQDVLQKEYLNYLFGMGKLLKFKTNSGIISGEISGVDSNGQLLVTSNGKTHAFQNKEIQFL
jgi:BirA family biotin operon repressor/biotin-[acetyl-CoA-carboxylase] ligase